MAHKKDAGLPQDFLGSHGGQLEIEDSSRGLTLLDVRGLPPCEPFDRIMAALDTLPPGETLEVLIHREPFPLYDWMRERGWTWTATREDFSGYEQFRLRIAAAR